VTVKLADRAPAAVGVNVTVTVHFPPAATLPPQLFVEPKSPAFAPLIAIELIANAAFPLFATVTACPALVCPTVRPL
jgi:hypothetical protein